MGKTIGELIEEKRIQAGAQNYKGHDYMDLMRFDENIGSELPSQSKPTGRLRI
uniref:DUF5720 family protein n=1 Tax=Dysosmobacter welbionis TaxID=2093857 RepID=UPI0040395C16